MKADASRESQTKDGRFVAIDNDAKLTVGIDLNFSAGREMETSALRLHAQGWNLTVPDRFGKLN